MPRKGITTPPQTHSGPTGPPDSATVQRRRLRTPIWARSLTFIQFVRYFFFVIVFFVYFFFYLHKIKRKLKTTKYLYTMNDDSMASNLLFLF